MSDLKSKLYSVRVPSDEVAAVEDLFRQYPGASPSLIIRALLHSAKPLAIGNALAKLHLHKVGKGGAS